ncbi:hypothetical protein LRH25_32235 [Ideonella azotifigens]|uniref:Uncharacterized protein n=1 Tax=Ideonella azotifigens TaxID=513160 RepID=A0ABN1KLI3_9BURK|nr:hypothetical protein [Ideonella azotifigens]MCD2344992.1 hypothetical protein [Ideonella azotifigens]
MGFNISWIAIMGATARQMTEDLGFTPTGKFATLASQPLQGAELPGKGYLVVARGDEHAILSPGFLAAHSEKHDIVACAVEEHVMHCQAACWRAGKMAWSAEHDGQESRRHLVTQGSLPASFDEILQAAKRLQDVEDSAAQEVDFFFEVPLQLAQSIAGFKHDEETPGLAGNGFETLASTRGQGPGRQSRWWEFWR